MDKGPIPRGTLVRLKFDHPSGPGTVFVVSEPVEARGFYRLHYRYKVDAISDFCVTYWVTAYETEFEIID